MTSFEVNYLASTLRADIGCLFIIPLNYLYMVVPSQYAVESRRPFFSTFHIKLGGLWAGCISILAYIMHVFSFSGKHKTKTKHKIRGTGGLPQYSYIQLKIERLTGNTNRSPVISTALVQSLMATSDTF